VLAVVLTVAYFALGNVYGLLPNFSSGNTVLGSSQSVIITQSGSLGVGTTNPQAALEVSTATANKPVVMRLAGNTPSTV
jgi:hypothetical protein